jgi:NCS1 family nucleobase:cation symporter-1
MLAVGLSWQQSLAAIIVGHLFLSWTITLNGTIGARLNVPFRESNYSLISHPLVVDSP